MHTYIHLSHHGRDAGTLASMHNAGDHGLDHVPAVDQCNASLAFSPEQAVKDEVGLRDSGPNGMHWKFPLSAPASPGQNRTT